jgi:predicted acetyltransferase
VERSPVAGGLEVLRRQARRALGRGRLAAAVATVRRPRGEARPPEPADVVLVPVEPGARGVLANLFQLYRHDMSEFRGYELDEDGTYDYPSLGSYLGSEDRDAWFIRVEGRLAGFVLTRRMPEGVWEVAEFFVARSERRRGIGRLALAAAFATHEGRWTCFADEVNTASERMCAAAAASVAGEAARAARGLSRTGRVGTVFRLDVAARA